MRGHNSTIEFLINEVLPFILCLPLHHREDAAQEAVLALVQGRNPLWAIGAYGRRERIHETRELTAQARSQIPKRPCPELESEITHWIKCQFQLYVQLTYTRPLDQSPPNRAA